MKGREDVGPRGGTTTHRRGQTRKTIWLNDDEVEVIRKHAYEEKRSESFFVREAIRKYFDLDDG